MTDSNDRTPRISASTLRKLHADPSFAPAPKWFHAPTAESSQPKRRNAHPEDDVQSEIIAWADGCDCLCGVGAQHTLGRHVWATPNGGRRNPREGARLKRQGVRAGVADLCVMHRRHLPECFTVAMVEIKVETGRQAQSQRDFESFVLELGGDYRIARSLIEFAHILQSLGLTWRESPIAKMRREKP